MTILLSAVSFIVVIGILVTAHEFGHFWVARRCGVKVLRFSIGFGKPLLRWRGKRDDTEYVLATIPLGGYVKMLDEREAPVSADEQHRAFNRQSLAVRSAIVSAGPVFNFLLAIVAFWCMFMVGVEGLKPIISDVDENSLAASAGLQANQEIIAVSGKPTPSWDQVLLRVFEDVIDDQPTTHVTVRDEAGKESQHGLNISQITADVGRGKLLGVLGLHPTLPRIPPVIGKLIENEPASQAGLLPGDRIVQVDNMPVEDWRDWVRYIKARPGSRIDVLVERDGKPQTITLIPATKQADSKSYGYVGAALSELPATPDHLRSVIQYSPLAAAGEAVARTGRVSLLMLRMLYKMVIGEASISNISGPITIAEYAGYSAIAGLAESLAFLALVSVSLGVLNLLPIPVLDGGHLLYYLVELVKGSPVSEKVQLLGQQIGLVILAMLITLAFYNDITRLL
ncbi:MAG: RIP metalloprotease RseP [Granulosicoccaceae bacterium]|jgi:regulator of sigma E protease